MSANNIKVFMELFKAIGHMYSKDEVFRDVFNERFEIYVDTLPEKEKSKIKFALMSFKK